MTSEPPKRRPFISPDILEISGEASRVEAMEAELTSLRAAVSVLAGMVNRAESVVVIDPEIQFGAPTVRGTRVTVETIAGMSMAGDSIAVLARGFNLDELTIVRALEWWHGFRAGHPDIMALVAQRELLLDLQGNVARLWHLLGALDLAERHRTGLRKRIEEMLAATGVRIPEAEMPENEE